MYVGFFILLTTSHSQNFEALAQEVTFMVTKKLTDWLAGLVSEIPKKTSETMFDW